MNIKDNHNELQNSLDFSLFEKIDEMIKELENKQKQTTQNRDQDSLNTPPSTYNIYQYQPYKIKKEEFEFSLNEEENKKLKQKYHQKLKYKEELHQFIKDEIKPTHFITINGNVDYLTVNKFESILRRLYKRTSSTCLRRSHLRDNFIMIGFFEETRVHQHLHVHLMVKMPKERDEWLCRIFEKETRKNIPASSIDIQKIKNLDNIISYCLKDFNFNHECTPKNFFLMNNKIPL